MNEEILRQVGQVQSQTELQGVLCDLEKQIENTFDKYQRLENKLQVFLMPQSPTKEQSEVRVIKNSELSERLQKGTDRLEKINECLIDLFERIVS
jgi:hypothetical protein